MIPQGVGTLSTIGQRILRTVFFDHFLTLYLTIVYFILPQYILAYHSRFQPYSCRFQLTIVGCSLTIVGCSLTIVGCSLTIVDFSLLLQVVASMAMSARTGQAGQRAIHQSCHCSSAPISHRRHLPRLHPVPTCTSMK